MINELKQYISENNIGGCQTQYIPGQALVEQAESRLKTKFGPQLREYLLTYGWLSYEGVSLHGLTMATGLGSDLISGTESARKDTRYLNDYVVIYYEEGWSYIAVDSDDNVYEWLLSCLWYDEPPRSLGKKLNEYIIDRLEEEKEIVKRFNEQSAFEDYVKTHISLPPDSERAAESVLCRAKKILGMEYNFDVECYLREYSLISYGNVHLCGLLKALGDYPNIVVETIKMRQKYPQTENLVTTEVLENEKYVVTDDDGKVLIFDGEKGEAYPTHKSFSKYYLERFEEEQKRMGK